MAARSPWMTGGAARGSRRSGGRQPSPHRRRGGGADLAAHPARDVVQRREVPQLQVRVPLDTEALPHRGEDLGLLDRVDPEVGLQVELGVEQVGR